MGGGLIWIGGSLVFIAGGLLTRKALHNAGDNIANGLGFNSHGRANSPAPNCVPVASSFSDRGAPLSDLLHGASNA